MTRAFLIGAGATKAQYKEAPLNQNFFSILKAHNKPLYDIINKTIGPYIGGSIDNFDIEDIMQSSDKYPHSNRISFFENLYYAIYQLLAIPTESDENNMHTYINFRKVRSPATLFKNLLTDNRLSEDDFFMTLNYDLYLDREILSLQKKIDYGIEKDMVNWCDSRLELSTDSIFSVYHLHGSLNWENNEDSINIHLGAVEPKYLRRGPSLCLIPPGKKELNTILKSVWSNAKKRLLEADELIIIGCSLNPHDTELIGLLSSFIEKHGAQNAKVIFLASESEFRQYIDDEPLPNDSTYLRYQNIIGKECNIYSSGFNISGNPYDQGYGALEFILGD